jgi:hypothetical protein
MRDFRREIALLVSIAIGFGLVALAVNVSVYTWLLFIGAPVLTGFVSVLIYSWNRHRELAPCLWLSVWPFAGICVLVLVFKLDGLICCLMAAPIVIPFGLLGGYIALYMQTHKAAVAASCLILFLPSGILLGRHGPVARVFKVSTAIVVDAPPETVWRHVTDFPAIIKEPSAIFRAGVAYPTESDIRGAGLGAARQCLLSTGRLDETVTAWNPPYLLRFDVNSTPPAMHELSPWRDIDPPHLHGFYRSYRGEFRLTELPGHRTLVAGTSWYSHGLEPAQYWRLWSDYVVHSVHRRVLTHIKELSEADAARIAAR